ncbi:DUF2500 domain-containing protein [Paenibacillus macerans]|uniref:DUF2500 domain-containing protein n=1 Tax=Paenibacillus macerans TaxID=44252 RepID=UPI00203DA5D5|nr:DUF2500 domain-containing protein [Paenibacillus macerans]MCM3702681.1 DUF2500 domain-containing protein [Paenibacillus macerans]
MQSWVEMFDMMETALPILLVVLTAIVVISAAGGVWRFFASSRQPVLSVNSVIVGKRTEVSHRHDTETSVNRSDTKYYITFEVESGDRLEFVVNGLEYGQCAEGDEGKLTFQGQRYHSFERVRNTHRTEVQEFRKYRSTL